MDSFDIGLFAGEAAILDVRGEKVVKMRPEWEEVFKKYPVILFCTGHDVSWGTPRYYGDYPVFEAEIALRMKDQGVRIAGFDSPSPDRSPYPFHAVFLEEERFLVENLQGLSRLTGKKAVDFFVFPLKIRAEASLVRAVALSRD